MINSKNIARPLLVFILFVSLTACAGVIGTVFSGRVVDESGRGIANATVFVISSVYIVDYSDSSSQITQTNEEGEFRLVTTHGIINVVLIMKEGYEPNSFRMPDNDQVFILQQASADYVFEITENNYLTTGAMIQSYYAYLADKTNNPAFCAKIPVREWGKNRLLSTGLCYYKLAQKTGDVSVCEKIEDSVTRSNCVKGVEE